MATTHEQFAIEHRIDVERPRDLGEGTGNVVARARIDSRFAAGPHDLHADAIPFPLCGKLAQVDFDLFERMREHERAEQRAVFGIRGRGAMGGPGEQLGIGRLLPVPVLLDILHSDIEGLREGGLAQPGGNADAHGACRQLEQRIAAIGIEPVEQLGQFGHDIGAGHA